MSDPFVFFDVRTRDLAGSRGFYQEMFGWTVQELDGGGAPITLFLDGGRPWAGFTPLGADDDRPPAWLPYVPVPDVDQAAKQAVALGATIVRPRTEIPQGSLVVITEPGGATVVLFEPGGG